MKTRAAVARKAGEKLSLETVDLELELAALFSRMLGIPRRIGEAIYMSPKANQARFDILRNASLAAFGPSPRENPESRHAKKKASNHAKVLDLVKRAEKCTLGLVIRSAKSSAAFDN